MRRRHLAAFLAFAAALASVEFRATSTAAARPKYGQASFGMFTRKACVVIGAFVDGLDPDDRGAILASCRRPESDVKAKDGYLAHVDR